MTLSIVNGIELFLNHDFRISVIESIKYCQRNKGLEVNAWCLTPNKLYMIAKATGGIQLSSIICDLKKFTSKAILKQLKGATDEQSAFLLKQFKKAASKHRKPLEHKVWEEGYYPDELFSPDYILQKLNFIHVNPIEQGKIKRSWEFDFSSAKDYSGINGSINVTKILT